jgi:hypothetical protein
MTPEEKAKELFNKFTIRTKLFDEFEGWKQRIDLSKAKQFALIAVDEILNHHNQEQGLFRIDKYYWQKVKHEIENL